MVRIETVKFVRFEHFRVHFRAYSSEKTSNLDFMSLLIAVELKE